VGREITLRILKGKTMKIKEIKEVVRSRYGKFAEKGGGKEAC
jgi:hypothetical protein